MSLVARDSPELMEVIARLSAAMLAGGIVGLNREITHKPAGLKTHALVALGSSLMTLLGMHLAAANSGHNADPASRVIQGLLAGIGFLGGGAILHQSDGNRVRGLTTAATLWIVVCLGVACGLGAWMAVIPATILTMMALIMGTMVEKALEVRFPKPPKPRAPDSTTPPSTSP